MSGSDSDQQRFHPELSVMPLPRAQGLRMTMMCSEKREVITPFGNLWVGDYLLHTHGEQNLSLQHRVRLSIIQKQRQCLVSYTDIARV